MSSISACFGVVKCRRNFLSASNDRLHTQQQNSGRLSAISKQALSPPSRDAQLHTGLHCACALARNIISTPLHVLYRTYVILRSSQWHQGQPWEVEALHHLALLQWLSPACKRCKGDWGGSKPSKCKYKLLWRKWKNWWRQTRNLLSKWKVHHSR